MIPASPPALLTVVIPTFNRSTLLVRALESCLQQKEADFKIIVSDNASTDDTAEVVNGFLADDRVCYHRQSSNIGAIRNISNAVWNLVDTRYFVIVSDDDYFIDDYFLKNAIERMEKDPELVLLHAEIEFEDQTTGRVEYQPRQIPGLMEGRDFFLRLGTREYGYVYLLTAVARTDIARKIKFFGDDKILHGDSLAWLRISLLGKVAFIRKPSARYVLHLSNSIKSTSIDQWLADIPFIELAYKDAAASDLFSSGELSRWLKRQRRYYVGVVIALLRKEELPRFWEVLKILNQRHRALRDWNLVLKVLKSLMINLSSQALKD
jgi:glycosyltransferase involved in cell wall biosynthesis